jgi:hypothetical protein
MRSETDKAKLQAFMAALGRRVRGPGRIYLTGGATAVLYGWRPMTIDIDLKPDLIRYPAIDPASFRSAVMDFHKSVASPAAPGQ